jgi:hypothetical protein
MDETNKTGRMGWSKTAQAHAELGLAQRRLAQAREAGWDEDGLLFLQASIDSAQRWVDHCNRGRAVRFQRLQAESQPSSAG